VPRFQSIRMGFPDALSIIMYFEHTQQQQQQQQQQQ
jgi:hypothetical protein